MCPPVLADLRDDREVFVVVSAKASDRATEGPFEGLFVSGSEGLPKDGGTWGHVPSEADSDKFHVAPFSPGILTCFQEVAEDFGTELGVLNLGMELEAKDGPFLVAHRLDRAVRRACETDEPGRKDGDLIVVGLPNLEASWEAVKQDVGLVDLDDRLPKLRYLRGFRGSAEVLRHELMARADSQDGPLENVEIIAVAPHFFRIDADPRRAAREDETIQPDEVPYWCIVRYDFRLDAKVFQDPPFPVGPLASVVDDEDSHAICKCRPGKKISPHPEVYSHSIVAGGLFETS